MQCILEEMNNLHIHFVYNNFGQIYTLSYLQKETRQSLVELRRTDLPRL